MNEPYRDHPSEDALERFLFNQSEEEELEIVESHFLACDACVTRLETLELDIKAGKMALRERLAEEAARLSQPAAKQGKLRRWFSVPQLSFAGAVMAACTLAVTFISVPREVNLVAERGDETQVVSEWLPLHLHLQARDLNAGPVTVAIVDQAGNQIWRTGALVKNEEIEVKAPRMKAQGDFLVQVYSAVPDGDPGNLLREYKLQAKSGF